MKIQYTLQYLEFLEPVSVFCHLSKVEIVSPQSLDILDYGKYCISMHRGLSILEIKHG